MIKAKTHTCVVTIIIIIVIITVILLLLPLRQMLTLETSMFYVLVYKDKET